MGIEAVIHELRLNKDFMSCVVAWERLRARKARYGEQIAIHPKLQQALAAQKIEKLFSHQTTSIEAVLRGENVVIATTTASGKSLCYNIPVLQRLMQKPLGRALYLFPTKALAQDQLNATAKLVRDGGLNIEVGVFDGDTPKSQRSKIRRKSSIILTNPDMIHAGILPFHTGWRDLFANLDTIVIDEIHTYRGVFGSHVANVLRRLRRICNFYGSDPQFICCSATIANPKEHAERLCEAPFTVIDEMQNGAPQGDKHFIVYNPPMIDEDLGLRQSMHLSATDAARGFLNEGVQSVVFARSRQGVELLLGYLRDAAQFDINNITDAQAAIMGYRGGYLPLERRSIEAGLRSGDVLGVVATNALELGVDIGALGAAILTGYPGSIASVWQQAGRAGRRDDLSAAILIAGNSPLDQYICKHPKYLFGRSAENALTNPDNLRIMVGHLQCAAFELPFEPNEEWGSFGPIGELLDYLQIEGELHQTRDRYHYVGDGAPSGNISLRTSGTDNVVIQTNMPDDAAPSRANPNIIGEVDLERAAVTVYQDAIYTHAGQSYLVDELDWDSRIAHVHPVEVDYYTRANMSSQISELSAMEEKVENDLLRAYGDVLIVSKATTYRKIKRYSQESLGQGKIDLPEWELSTTGYWLIMGEQLSERLFEMGVLRKPNDYGPNWQDQRQLALEREEFRCKTCGSGANLQVHHIRPFKEFYYVRGVNDNYLEANLVDNLVALCASCHRQAEASVATRSAMGGLSYVLSNLAPLFLMCDAGDISVSAETRNAYTRAPTLVVYERVAAGVGFSEKLFEIHHVLLRAALELVTDCNCREGCPACVGPPGEIGPNTKQVTKQLLKILTA